jgi:hypothetical protein
LLAAATTTGEAETFESLLETARSRRQASEPLSKEQRELIEALRRDYFRAYAQSFEEFFGSARALELLAALQRAPVKRFFAARRAMAPELAAKLELLKRQMGAMEI